MAGTPVKAPNKRRMARFTLYDLINYTQIPLQRAKELANVHEATWRRWMAGTSNPPTAVVELIRLHATGKVMPDSFGDCFFNHHGELIDDYGNSHELGDLRVHTHFKKAFHKNISMLKTHDMILKPRLVEAIKDDDLVIQAQKALSI